MRCHTAAAAPEKESDCRHILQVRARDGWRMLQYKKTGTGKGICYPEGEKQGLTPRPEGLQ